MINLKDIRVRVESMRGAVAVPKALDQFDAADVMQRIVDVDAPAMLTLIDQQTRALVLVEWERATKPQDRLCPDCGVQQYDDHQSGPNPHEPDCWLDQALTAAGLDTQQKRDDARRALGVA